MARIAVFHIHSTMLYRKYMCMIPVIQMNLQKKVIFTSFGEIFKSLHSGLVFQSMVNIIRLFRGELVKYNIHVYSLN